METILNMKKKCADLNLRWITEEGNPAAKLWIVKAFPTSEEFQFNKAFVGASGYFFDRCLEIAGVNRRHAYITFIQPSEGYADPELWNQSIEAFTSMVRMFKPHLVLAVGEAAYTALTGNKGLKLWRGVVTHNVFSKVMSTFDPAEVLLMGDASAKKEAAGKGRIRYGYGSGRITLLNDLKRAKAEAALPDFELPDRKLWSQSSFEEIMGCLEHFARAPELAFDIETKGNWIDRIAFSDSSDFALSIEIDKGPMKEEVKGRVKDLLTTHKGLIAQNGFFDVPKISHNWEIRMPRLLADTMVAHHLLYPDLPHDLGYMASVYCNVGTILHPPGWEEDDSRGDFNALHTAVTIELWDILREELRGAIHG